MSPKRTSDSRSRYDPETTRQVLLDAAFDEIYLNGFRAAGLDAILSKTGVTKGALYHHFGNKQGLGYAVVEERVDALVHDRYIDPFKATEDPIQGMQQMGLRMESELLKVGILKKGCPVNNLVQEMSGVDEGFRLRLAKILDKWSETIADGLRRGQAEGTVRSDIDALEVATFFVASYQGACGYCKNSQDIKQFTDARKHLDKYVETLRAVPQKQTAA